MSLACRTLSPRGEVPLGVPQYLPRPVTALGPGAGVCAASTPRTGQQTLTTCRFSPSAMLARVLIAIYILQRFALGEEPAVTVPSWQGQAVKWHTVCCVPRGAVSTQAAHTCVCEPRAGQQARGFLLGCLYSPRLSCLILQARVLRPAPSTVRAWEPLGADRAPSQRRAGILSPAFGGLGSGARGVAGCASAGRVEQASPRGDSAPCPRPCHMPLVGLTAAHMW